MTQSAAPMPPGSRHTVPYRDTVIAGLGALLVYVLVRQHTMYSVDTHMWLTVSLRGVLMHNHHLGYMPLLALSRVLVMACGGTMHTAGLCVSAVGAAIGVTFAHAAYRRLGLSRRDAAMATALVAMAPGILFFASVVEVHAEHFGTCGAMFFCIAAFAIEPAKPRGLLLGLGTALGFVGHATGTVLPALALPLALALALERGHALRRCVPGLVTAAAVHGALVLAIPRTLHAFGFQANLQGSAHHLATQFVSEFVSNPAILLHTAWYEWLRPFMPIGLAVPIALLRRGRGVAVAATATLGVYLGFTAILLSDGSERGAYLLPLSWSAGLLAVRTFGPRVQWAALAIAVAVGLFEIRNHDTRPQQPFVDGYREVIGDRKAFALVGTYDEVAAMLIDLPKADWHVPFQELDIDPAFLDIGVKAYDQWLADKLADGREFWVTTGAVTTLSDAAWTRGRPAGPRLLAHLRERFDWNEHRAHGFVGWRLQAKAR